MEWTPDCRILKNTFSNTKSSSDDLDILHAIQTANTCSTNLLFYVEVIFSDRTDKRW